MTFALAVTAMAAPRPLGFESISIGGELRERIALNFSRLESQRYQPQGEGCFRAPVYNWPGDMEGRTLLSLSLLEQAAGRRAVHLTETLAKFPAHMNAEGFFGRINTPDVVDEQQLSSHGWVLRGLCERYLATKDPQVRDMIENIVDHLALPTRGFHARYPIVPEQRTKDAGSYIGTATQQLGHWKLSSDIGCDFIFMDGLMQAATMLQRPEVDALAEEMLARFLQVDLAAIKAQTHASLTGMRGVLRWAVFTGRPELVAEVEKRFQLYLTEGMSENHANWNWFGRPTHTEPCAVVDAFMVAVQLWQLTGRPGYLEQAHLMYFNALGHGQRANGGFGCDTCLGAESATLRIRIPEAWWCCTMRGSEGLARAAEYAFMQDAGALVLPFFHSGTASLKTAQGVLQVALKTGYPAEGRIQLQVVAAPPGEVEIRFFVLTWAQSPRLAVEGQPVAGQSRDGFLRLTAALRPGDVVAYDFDQSVRTVGLANRHNKIRDGRCYYYGPLLLGAEGVTDVALPDTGDFTWNPQTQTAGAPGLAFALRPINDMFRRSEVSEQNYERRMIWKTK